MSWPCLQRFASDFSSYSKLKNQSLCDRICSANPLFVTTLSPSGSGAPLLWPQLTPGHSLFRTRLFFASLTGPPGVRHTSFVRQPPDLPSRLYVYPLGFGLLRNLTRRLALYQVSVRRLLDFATPLPPLLALPPAACGSLRLAVNTRDRTSTG